MATNIENTITTKLKDLFQNSKEIQNLSPSVRNALNTSINKSLDTVTPDLFKKVEGETNSQLDAIPKNLIGTFNPVDLVNSNLQPSGLNNTLSPIINENLSGPLSSQLYNSIIGDFTNKLPPSVAGTLNLSTLQSALTRLSTSAVSEGLDLSLTDISTSKFETPLPIPETVPGVDSIFETQGDNALQAVDEQFAAAVSTQAIREAQSFDTQAPQNEEKLITQTVGFIDPDATYPTPEYKGRTEVNKLATSDVNGTIVQTKDKEKRLGVQLPENQYWEQPKIPYKGQYPYNKVTQTESGHIIEIDDTPGAERLHVFHRTGTYIEIDSVGNIIKKTKGSSYEIIDKNGHVSITGDCNLSVKGGVKVFVGQDADIEVIGDVNLKCYNDISMQAGGKVNISATEEINLRSANINIEADINLSMKGDVNAFLSSYDIHTKSNNTMYFEALNDVHMLVEDEMFVTTGSDMEIKVGEQLYITTVDNTEINVGNRLLLTTSSDSLFKFGGVWNSAVGSSISWNAGSTINMDGTQTYIQSGTSTGSVPTATIADEAEEALYPYPSTVGYLGPGKQWFDIPPVKILNSTASVRDVNSRKDVFYDFIPNPIAPNFADVLGLNAEDAELPEESKKQEQQLKQFGVASESDLNQKAVEIKRETPASKNDTVVMSSESIINQTYLPDNYQLSKHFTLASLTTKAAVSKYPLQPQLGLTYGQIAYNLQGIALNVLEPLLAMYPKMLVTSAFRSAASSSSTSDHPRGKAVDIQFPGVSKAMYFDIAKKLAENLNYDKLLLEYKTYGTGMPWIHISFDINQQRKIVLTYLNDRKYGDGLINIA